MTAITTTQDYVTWYVNTGNHTEEELKDYIASLDYNNADDVRIVSVQTVDKVIQINGITFHAPAYIGGEGLFNTALGSYSELNNIRVKAIHYYVDRDSVMVEYLAHPADPTPMNTYHPCSAFGTLFNILFTTWKSSFAQIYAGTLTSIATQQPANPLLVEATGTSY